jgi:mRNA-degrading endonuclease toxin of MazEF toxin-antitoxin module
MNRGDVYLVDLDPTVGHEQRGQRYVVIISPPSFNRISPPIICPITQGGEYTRDKGFAISLSGLGTRAQGIIMVNQPRSLDLRKRGAKFIETLPNFIVDDAVERLFSILEGDT